MRGQGRRWTARGQGTTEYALLLALIALLTVGSLRLVGGRTTTAFGSVSSGLKGGSSPAGATPTPTPTPTTTPTPTPTPTAPPTSSPGSGACSVSPYPIAATGNYTVSASGLTRSAGIWVFHPDGSSAGANITASGGNFSASETAWNNQTGYYKIQFTSKISWPSGTYSRVEAICYELVQ